jgi:hypothetical protein
MARTQLRNLALPRSPEDGLAGSGSAFDKQFTSGTRAVGIAGDGHQRNANRLWLTLGVVVKGDPSGMLGRSGGVVAGPVRCGTGFGRVSR